MQQVLVLHAAGCLLCLLWQFVYGSTASHESVYLAVVAVNRAEAEAFGSQNSTMA